MENSLISKLGKWPVLETFINQRRESEQKGRGKETNNLELSKALFHMQCIVDLAEWVWSQIVLPYTNKKYDVFQGTAEGELEVMDLLYLKLILTQI